MDEVSVTIEVSAWLFRAASFYREVSRGPAICLRGRIQNRGLSYFSLSSGENPADLDAVLDVFEGEPILGSGERVKDGGGMLSYIPSADLDDEVVPASLAGWCAVTSSSFDALWRVLCERAPLVVRAQASVAPVGFQMPDRYVWDVKANKSLVITTMELTAAVQDSMKTFVHEAIVVRHGRSPAGDCSREPSSPDAQLFVGS